MATFDGTTLERIRLALLKDSDDTKHDSILSLLITEASAQVEAYLARPFLLESRQELQSVDDPRQISIFLHAAPVASVASVEFDSSGQFAGLETTIDADRYILDLRTGEMRLRFTPSVGFNCWRVTYTAGLAADTAALIAAYPLIARAIDLQVVALYHRVDDPQAESRSLGGAAVKVSEPMGLIKAAENTCGAHRMIRFP
jgi:uncharacterized phiE125 gp8 family phage protein